MQGGPSVHYRIMTQITQNPIQMGLGPMGSQGSPTPLHKPIRLRKWVR